MTKELSDLDHIGGNNTKFFHHYANDRRARNAIWEIKSEDDYVVRDPQGIEVEPIKHYH